MTTWFTSDTHFGHAKVIEYCKRPYADVEEMNRVMAERWNARVKPEDTVIHLGDFAMGPVTYLDGYVEKLNGNIWLIKGNHDRSTTRMLAAGFEKVVAELYVKVDDVMLFLRHHPTHPRFWEAQAKIHLCGHVHNSWAREDNTINVGVDVRDFEPKTLQELLYEPDKLYNVPAPRSAP